MAATTAPNRLNLARLQGLLLDERNALLTRINEEALAERDAPEVVERPRETLDAGDSAVYENAEDERLSGAQRATERIRVIDGALRRIEQGDYGICVDCGEPIDERRLLSIPEAERCTPCQELFDERQGSRPPSTL